MSVIVEVRVDWDDFALGRVLDPPEGARVQLEGGTGDDGALPFWVVDTGEDPDVVATVEDRDPVESVRSVQEFGGRTLYALEWDHDDERLLSAAADLGGHLLDGGPRGPAWRMKLRFPDEEALSRFTGWCSDNGVDLAIEERYVAESATSYDLTDRQRDTLELAVELGYYDIPRTTTTQELADELGVSDQAVTERLRRAITTLTERTLLSGDD